MATIPTYGDPNVTDTPYHIGDESLVTFKGDPTIWLVDNKSKTLRAFSSDMAFNNAYADPEYVRKNFVKEVDPSQRSAGGTLDSSVYHLLDPQYSIKDDGKVPPVDYNPGYISSIYGQQTDETKLQKSSMALDGLFDMIKNTNTGVSPSFLDTLTKDKNAMAFYIGAAAYGGYSVPDILMDIKRKELVSQGRTDLASVSPISQTKKKSEYQNSNEYRDAATNPLLTPPPMIGKLNIGLMNLPVFSLPDEAFKALVPTLDPNSGEFQKRFDQVVDGYHDILAKQLSATTEAEKSVADHEWDVFKSTASRDLGIKLSGNAVDAWKQIEDAHNAFSQRGVEGSGLQNEAIDDYLKGVRKNDQITRQATMDVNDQKEMEYYTKFATPDQVRQLMMSNPEKAKNFGLMPSDDIKTSLSFSALKAKYPTMSDKDINRYISSTLDENGNYRSNLYQKHSIDQINNTVESDQFKRDTLFTQAGESDRLKRLNLGQGEPFVRTPDSQNTTAPTPTNTTGTYPNQNVIDTLGKKDKIQALTDKNTTPSNPKYDSMKSGEDTATYLKRIGVTPQGPSPDAVALSKKLALGRPKIKTPVVPTAPASGLHVTIPNTPQVSSSTPPTNPPTKFPAAPTPTQYKSPGLWGSITNSARQMFGF